MLTGEQLGEYFGAALTAADVNGDGLTDLIVGSPMFSRTNHSDVGRIHTFLSGEVRFKTLNKCIIQDEFLLRH